MKKFKLVIPLIFFFYFFENSILVHSFLRLAASNIYANGLQLNRKLTCKITVLSDKWNMHDKKQQAGSEILSPFWQKRSGRALKRKPRSSGDGNEPILRPSDRLPHLNYQATTSPGLTRFSWIIFYAQNRLEIADKTLFLRKIIIFSEFSNFLQIFASFFVEKKRTRLLVAF